MIEIHNLSVQTIDRTSIIDDFSTTIHVGEKVVLTGPSGCGKSTLLRAIPGGAEFWSGKITIDSIPLNPRTVAEVRSKIAMIPQEPKLPTGNVQAYFDLIASFQGKKRKFTSKLINSYLEKLNLEKSILSKECDRISGGERQRIAVIGALLLERPILLADEITSALDHDSRDAVLALLWSLPLTILSVAHDPHWITACNRSIELGGQHA